MRTQTGYWVSGSTTNRTAVHVVYRDTGRPICGVAIRTRRTYQGCAIGPRLEIVECARCLAKFKMLPKS